MCLSNASSLRGFVCMMCCWSLCWKTNFFKEKRIRNLLKCRQLWFLKQILQLPNIQGICIFVLMLLLNGKYVVIHRWCVMGILKVLLLISIACCELSVIIFVRTLSFNLKPVFSITVEPHLKRTPLGLRKSVLLIGVSS